MKTCSHAIIIIQTARAVESTRRLASLANYSANKVQRRCNVHVQAAGPAQQFTRSPARAAYRWGVVAGADPGF